MSIFPWTEFSWHSGSLWDRLGWLNWFWQILCDRLSSYIPKEFFIHMHGLAVDVKEGLPFAWYLSLENSTDCYLCFQLALLHSVSYFFFIYWSPSFLCNVFDSISSNIDEVLSINPSTNTFVFEDFNTHYKDWLTYSDGTDRPVENSPALLVLFLSSGVGICSTMAFIPLGNSDHVVVSVSINFPPNPKWDAPFHCLAYDNYHVDWDSFHDHLRNVPWEDIFKFSASAAASEFCEWVRIDLYISHHMYLVNPHSSLWFSAACAATIVQRNHFFVCTRVNLNLK